ncbi:MAG: hypothetical protein INR64_14310 [Caulobacteraceae bacterium]|nr:hypothetical protein [Caulobacter sp.]
MTFAQEMDVLSKNDPHQKERRGWVQAHPQIGRTWLGDTNPEIWWWSALSKRCLPLLAGFHGRVLVEQGTKDEDVPFVSATSLVEGLRRDGAKVEFHQMATGHDLGLSSLAEQENGVAYALGWMRRRIDASERRAASGAE